MGSVDGYNAEKKKYYLALVIRNILKIFWVFPVRNNKIICMTGTNEYCDSGKYISEYLIRNYPGTYEVIWPTKKLQKNNDLGIKYTKPLSFKHFYSFCTAKIIITNGGMPPHFPKRKKQFYINTWHGGGAYKKLEATSEYRVRLNEYKNRCTDVYISSCRTFSELVIPSMTSGYSGEIMSCGMPRNDIMFLPDMTGIRNKVCKALGADRDKLMILYAPTYRGGLDHLIGGSEYVHRWSIEPSEICSAVRERFGKEAVFVFRQHRFDSSSALDKCIDASDYPDMQELLCAADVLISDYSSTIWDFSLMKKPCFLYVPDLEYYSYEDRGFFTPIETWPGIIARTNEELRTAILAFDEDTYREKVEKHHRDLGSYETGTACKQVCERIVQVCGR